jgi:hypothetical protein
VPYIHCPSCGLRTFSVAYWSSTEECERCGEPLPRQSRAYRPPNPSPQLLAEFRARRRRNAPARPPER